AEMILPDAVHDDPRSERVFRLREPLGQRSAAARRLRQGRDRGGTFAEDGEKAGLNVAELFALGDGGGRGLRTDIHGGERRGQWRGLFGVEGGELLLQFDQLVLLVALHGIQQVVPFV